MTEMFGVEDPEIVEYECQSCGCYWKGYSNASGTEITPDYCLYCQTIDPGWEMVEEG